MERFGKQVTPDKLKDLQRQLYIHSGWLGAHVEELRREHQSTPPEDWTRDTFWKTHRWPQFVVTGYFLADAILGTLEIPPGKTKELELATRLFLAKPRYPRDIVKWFDLNEKKINFLYDAVTKWELKGEGKETEQKFTLGPFTVHNTLGLTGAKLDGMKDTLLKVISKMQHLPLPDFGKALYGEIYLVGQIRKAKNLAWYRHDDDTVYVRPFTKYSTGFAQAVIHELCHRYWTKFLPRSLQQDWNLWYMRVGGSVKDTEFPKVGDVLEVHVRGYNKVPRVQQIKFDYGKPLLMIGENAADELIPISLTTYLNAVKGQRLQGAYPTAYSATSYEEYFCEAASLLALGELKEPHKDAFLSIFVRKAGPPAAEVLVSKTANISRTFTLDGERFRWKRATKSMRSYDDQDFRSWHLVNADGSLFAAFLSHTKANRYTPQSLEPSWQIMLRFRATDEERKEHGGFVQFNLKKLIPSTEGNEDGTLEAMQLAERALLKFYEDRKSKQGKTAGTYVQISRDELEAWLNTLPFKGSWRRDKINGREYAGVYLIPLSDLVGVRLSSTIGSKDDAMGRGEASMRLSLVSLITGQTLNKKAMGQNHFNRTTNWQKTWRVGFDRMKEAYTQSQGFYDALAPIEDRAKYQKDMLALIESIPGWEHNSFLQGLHERVAKGGVLTTKQQEAVENSNRKAPTQGNKPDEAYLKRLHELSVAAKRVGDAWLLDFLRNIAPEVKAGRPLSPRRQEILDEKLTRYKVGSLYRSVIRKLI